MRIPLSPFAFAAALASAALPVLAGDKTEAEIAEICGEAEERYVDIYGAPSAEAEGVTVVTMYKYSFCPPEIAVPVGTTVRWVNVDRRTSHSVIAKGQPESDRVFPEEAIEFTFLEASDPQEYLCGPHWESHEMIGMVTVVEE
ncbi:copper-binding protein [Aliiroseovarius sp.]|uniref:cupredoxin domain-containing protein n=1 Tax=Aliiroseovarius sp. TaxID=1872442 RepID=UPI002638B9F6|nr:copper-binding protein [Aliiroseovarius sp.]